LDGLIVNSVFLRGGASKDSKFNQYFSGLGILAWLSLVMLRNGVSTISLAYVRGSRWLNGCLLIANDAADDMSDILIANS
jgi:hypothetical protein